MKLADYMKLGLWKDIIVGIVIVAIGLCILISFDAPLWELIAFGIMYPALCLIMLLTDYRRRKRCIEDAKHEQDEQIDNDYSEHYDIRP